MKDQVKEMYEQIKMPEACVQRTKEAMKNMEQKRKQRRLGLRPAVALAALLIAGLGMNTRVRAAVNEMVRYVFADIAIIREEGEWREVSFETEENGPVFLETDGGKMYLSVYGQYIDITDKCSMEKPYIYTFVDEENIEHILIIGGEADNFGVSEFYREIVEGQPEWNGWIGGYSENYIDNSTGMAYPWMAAAWEELDLPWPMPGT